MHVHIFTMTPVVRLLRYRSAPGEIFDAELASYKNSVVFRLNKCDLIVNAFPTFSRRPSSLIQESAGPRADCETEKRFAERIGLRTVQTLTYSTPSGVFWDRAAASAVSRSAQDVNPICIIKNLSTLRCSRVTASTTSLTVCG
jgi:hypothetical protein